MLGVRLNRTGALLGVSCYAVALLVFALLRRADQDAMPSLFLAIASSLLPYAAGRSLAFGPKRDPDEEQDEDERSVRIAAGIAGAVFAVTLLALFGSAIASAVALATLMPIYLAIYVFYDSKARAKPEPERR